MGIDEKQFCFMSWCGNTSVTFILKQLQQKHFAKKNLYFAFVDLEKVFDLVIRDVTSWTLRKLGEEEWLVKVVKSMHRNAWSCIRVNGTFSDDFVVQVVLHQHLVLSSLLHIIVLEALTRPEYSQELLYVDDWKGD